MDRRKQHRAFLSGGWQILAVAWAVGWAVDALAQSPPGQNAAPNVTATPWVQASPPVNAAPTPGASVGQGNQRSQGNTVPPPAGKATPAANQKGREPVAGTPQPTSPKPGNLPGTADQKSPAPHSPLPALNQANVEDVKAKMLRERQRELEQMPDDDAQTGMSDAQETYGKTARFYRNLSPEEQSLIRAAAAKRIREELDAAYRRSGLALSDDQREVFDLRYRQERRQLELEIREKARSERNRRVPQIIDQLKKEFEKLNPPASPKAMASPSTPAPTVAPPPTPNAMTPPTATPGSAINGVGKGKVEATGRSQVAKG